LLRSDIPSVAAGGERVGTVGVRPGRPGPAGDAPTLVFLPCTLYNEAMAEPERDTQVRQEAFQYLSRQQPYWDDGLVRWATLIRGFEFHGLRVPLCSMQGIFKPKAMTYAPLSLDPPAR
jgi:hypothetical protein